MRLYILINTQGIMVHTFISKFQEKISSPLHPGLEKFFPKYELYQLSEAHREEAVSAATSPDAVNTEYLRAKYFIRDLFLGASLHCGAEHRYSQQRLLRGVH